MANHTVKQGEHLSGIALDHGIANWKTIWERPENAALRQKRKNPNILMAGDKLFIPERESKSLSGGTEQRHRFQLEGSNLMLRLVFHDVNDEPIVNKPCDLHVGPTVFEHRTDDAGRIEQKIAPGTTSATIVFDREVTFDVAIPLQVGGLDPVEEPSGQRARLNNLGYVAGTPGESGSPENEAEREAQFASAVEEFQCDQGLKVDGQCGAKTQARLKQAHGC